MTNCMGNSALHFCREYKYDALYEYLLKKGANPRVTNIRGRRAHEGIDKRKFYPGLNGEINTNAFN